MAAEENAEKRHERFCREYIIDYNGTQAAIRAGYSQKSAASQANRLLRDADVLSRVRELQKEQTERLCLSADWVVQRLMQVVDRCLQLEPVLEWDYEEKCKKPTGQYVFDSKGANQALETLGKHLGMLDKKVQADTPGESGVVLLPPVTDEEPPAK